jgi:beta-lactamase regulating signal transducer with metallopeptidase domain
MPLAAFTQIILLKAIALAMLHSIWQTALIAIVYWCCTQGVKKSNTIYRYYAGIGSIYVAASWFLVTVAQQYAQLNDSKEEAINIAYIKLQWVEAALPYLSLLYTTILGWQLMRLTYQYIQLSLLQHRQLHKIPAGWRLFARQTAMHLGIKHEVPIWMSEHIGVPCVLGIVKPAILLPAQLATYLTQSQIEAIILHELAHIKRLDPLLNLLQLLAEKLLHFNPLVYWLSARVRQHREYCCDDLVLNFNYNANEYATALYLIEKNYQQFSFLIQAANGHKKNLLDRIKRVCSSHPSSTLTVRHRWQLSSLLMLVIVMISAVLSATKWATAPAKYESSAILLPSQNTGGGSMLAERRPTLMNNASEAIQPAATQPIKPAKKAPVAKAAAAAEETTVKELAYINEELLQPATVYVAASAGYATNNRQREKVLIRVEEEISGTAGKKIYYLQADTAMQMIDIKPMALVTEKKLPVTKAISKTPKLVKGKIATKKQPI